MSRFVLAYVVTAFTACGSSEPEFIKIGETEMLVKAAGESCTAAPVSPDGSERRSLTARYWLRCVNGNYAKGPLAAELTGRFTDRVSELCRIRVGPVLAQEMTADSGISLSSISAATTDPGLRRRLLELANEVRGHKAFLVHEMVGKVRLVLEQSETLEQWTYLDLDGCGSATLEPYSFVSEPVTNSRP